MTDEQTGSGEAATTLRPLAPEEAERLFLMPAPEQEYSFYVLDPPPAPDGWIAEGQWVESLHGQGWSVLGVWEVRQDPLLLRVRPLWIERDIVERQHRERQQTEQQLREWRTAPGDSPQDRTWTLPCQPLRDAPSSYWATPRDLQALVDFLAGWLGDEAALPAPPTLPHFRLKTRPGPEEPPDLEELLEVGDPAEWLEAPVGEPSEDTAPWPPDEDLWEPDIPVAAPPDEEPDWDFVDPPEVSEVIDEPIPPWTWDPEEFYFGEPAYTYSPSPGLPSARELYTMVSMPTWQRAQEAEPWQRRMRGRRDPQLGLVEVDIFSVVSYRLDDLRDPDFDSYIDVPGVGYIELDRSALLELKALLQQRIDQFMLTAPAEAHPDSEEGSR